MTACFAARVSLRCLDSARQDASVRGAQSCAVLPERTPWSLSLSHTHTRARTLTHPPTHTSLAPALSRTAASSLAGQGRSRQGQGQEEVERRDAWARVDLLRALSFTSAPMLVFPF
eukprot:6172059-Pleurochrysis_carterae.AAC.2